jgi:N-hydroxyarylamine O-acetyltransferase
MRLRDGEVVTGNDGIAYRLRVDAEYQWMTERDAGQGFRPQYNFTLDVAHPLDLEMSNLWTSTWKGSRFTQNVIASIVLPHGTASLTNRAYVRESKGEKVESEITSVRMLQMRLSLIFGIDLTMEEVAALGLF